jgi:hypothetical protein
MKLSFRAMSTSLARVAGMTRKFLAKPKVTDAQRHDRFVAMTQRIGALDDVKNFEKAFQEAFKSAIENVACSKRPSGYARRRPEGN